MRKNENNLFQQLEIIFLGKLEIISPDRAIVGKRIAVIYRNLLEFVSEKNSRVAALKILALASVSFVAER